MNRKKWGFIVVAIIIILALLGIFLYRQIITGRQIAGVSVTEPTNIAFIDPTRPNGTIISEDFFRINASVVESDLRDIIFNWNNVNYSFYDDSLVLMMNFDNRSELGENDTYAVDLSKSSNNGSIVNATFNSIGRYGGALEFDESNDSLVVGTTNWNLNLTISMWFYAKEFSSGTNANYLFGHTTQPAFANRIQIYTNDASGLLDLGIGNSHTLRTNIIDLDTNKWYYVTLTLNGTNYTLYLNGAQIAVGAYSGLTALDSFADIGNNGNPATRAEAFNGTIDEVRIWNRSLSAEEVMQQY